MPPPTPAAPRYTAAQRRLLTAAAGLGVAVLAGAAFVLTYDDLRALAIEGRAAERWAPAYPIMVDGLIVVTILSLVLARQTRWWTRALRWTLLLVLLGGTGTASVQRAVNGYGDLPDEPLQAAVATAPHAMLLIAAWLWLTMFKHARAALTGPPARTDAEEEPEGELGERRAERHGAEPDEPPAHDPAVQRAAGYDLIPGFSERGHVDSYDGEADRVDRWVVEEAWLDQSPPPGVDDDPTPPAGAALLPTDVELVRRDDPRPPSLTSTTQPDLIPFLPTTDPPPPTADHAPDEAPTDAAPTAPAAPTGEDAQAAPNTPDTQEAPGRQHAPDWRTAPDRRTGPDTQQDPDAHEDPDTHNDPNAYDDPNAHDDPDTRDDPDTYNGPNAYDDPDTRDDPDTHGDPDTYNRPSAYGDPDTRDGPSAYDDADTRDSTNAYDGPGGQNRPGRLDGPDERQGPEGPQAGSRPDTASRVEFGESDPAEDDESPVVERAEDPDAGENDEPAPLPSGRHRIRPGGSHADDPEQDGAEAAAADWSELTPPSSRYRSSPTPPDPDMRRS